MLLALFFQKEGSPDPLPAATCLTLPGVIQQMTTRSGPWNGFKASVTLEFVTEMTHAACQGELTYSRLEEKAALDCYNLKRKLLFSYTAKDEEFELYLPGTGKVTHGNIFDVKYSPEITLHLEPLDLYRALKIMPVIPEQASLENRTLGTSQIRVQNRLTHTLARTLEVSPEGDVVRETFYRPNETPDIEITRTGHQAYPVVDSSRRGKTHYPEKVEIQSLESPRKTRLVFRRIAFYTALGPDDWPKSRLNAGTLAERLGAAKQ